MPRLAAPALTVLAAFAADADEPPASKPLSVLFLGDNGHHRPANRFAQIAPVLAGRGIELTYTEMVSDLNLGTLGKYDALLIYANTTRISIDQASTPGKKDTIANIELVKGRDQTTPIVLAATVEGFE